MIVAIIGSRTLTVEDMGRYLPPTICGILSGGARGVDTCAQDYALAHRIPLIEFLPEYQKYGRAAPLKRNEELVKQADCVVAFWDGQSRGTKYTIQYAKRRGVALRLFLWQDQQWALQDGV